jgi:UDP:flavonoid glycosyltransferase YjiC (YdhE family)
VLGGDWRGTEVAGGRADLLFTGMSFEPAAANVAEYYDIPLATLHYFPMRDNGQLVPFLPAPLSRSAIRVYDWLTAVPWLSPAGTVIAPHRTVTIAVRPPPLDNT